MGVFIPLFQTELVGVNQDGERSKETEGQNVLLCLLCANMPGGAQEETS